MYEILGANNLATSATLFTSQSWLTNIEKSFADVRYLKKLQL